MKRHSSLLTSILSFLLLSVTTAASALAACPERASSALAAADNVCSQTARNRACYGHALLEAEAQPNIAPTDFVFNAPGNQVDVAALRALRLMPMDATSEVWGVALLKLQANLPDDSPEDVTMVLFGDAHIENATAPATQTDFVVTAAQAVNVRSVASPDAWVIGTLPSGQIVTGLERVSDNSWVRVRLPETGALGWVSAALLTGDLNTLNVVGAFEPHYAPMQAFYFQSGSSSAGCDQAANGLIIQTPEGMGKVRLWMNEVRLQIGSTVYFEAVPGGDMLIRTLEGSAVVEARGITQNAVAGTQVRVALDDNLRALTPPTIPEPYELAEAQALPVTLLDRQIEVAQPLTTDQITAILVQSTPEPTSVPADKQIVVSAPTDNTGTGDEGETVVQDTSTGNDNSETTGGGEDPNSGEQPPPDDGGEEQPPSDDDQGENNGGLIGGVIRLIRDVLD